MDRCHCKEYAEAVKNLKFYTVGTLRPDILQKFNRTGWSVCWIKKRIDLNMMTFEKPVALFESLSPEDVARKDRLEHMWCGYLDNYKLGQNKLD